MIVLAFKRSKVIQVPASITRQFSFGKRDCAPITAAKRSLPNVLGVSYKFSIGTVTQK